MTFPRLFFAFSVQAPWPDTYPEGRVIEKNFRHITLSFLGNCSPPPMENCPLPPFTTTPIGKSHRILFLPSRKPRVVAHEVDFLTFSDEISHYHDELSLWLQNLGYRVDQGPLLPHLTISRGPFDQQEWEENFSPLPLVITGIHLYESFGHLQYAPRFSHTFPKAFEELPHTADLAFRLTGTSFSQLYLHGLIAISFTFPPLIRYLAVMTPTILALTTLDGVIGALNQTIAHCDAEIGAPIKAVSYHGTLHRQGEQFSWEMIVDV